MTDDRLTKLRHLAQGATHFDTWQRLLDQFFADIPDEQDARTLFENLVLASYRFTRRFGSRRGADFLMLMSDTYADWSCEFDSGATYMATPQSTPAVIPRCPRLAHRWRGWAAEFRQLLDRHPRVEMKGLLQDISESREGASWPYGLETAIRDWVDLGIYSSPRYASLRRDTRREDFERMVELRRKTYPGWWFWHDGQVRWFPNGDEHWRGAMSRIESLHSYGYWKLRSDDFWRDFLPEEAETRRKHERLLFVSCRYTMRFGGTDEGADLLLRLGDPYHHHAYTFVGGGTYSGPGQPLCVVPKCKRLAEAWEKWICIDFKALLVRQPRLALREIISRVSENFDATSWPYSYEKRLLRWIDLNDYEAEDPIFRIGVSLDHYERLVRLRRLTRGWWWWDDDLGRVVWREDENG